jgi:hypothetical protein
VLLAMCTNKAARSRKYGARCLRAVWHEAYLAPVLHFAMRAALGAGPVQSISPSARRRILCSPIEDCLLQLPFAAASCFLRPSCAAPVQVPTLSPKPLFRPSPSSPLHCSFGLSTRALSRRRFFSTTAAQIASHLQPSRAPPPRSVSWARQTLPLSRDSYHIVRSFLPVSHLHSTPPPVPPPSCRPATY